MFPAKAIRILIALFALQPLANSLVIESQAAIDDDTVRTMVMGQTIEFMEMGIFDELDAKLNDYLENKRKSPSGVMLYDIAWGGIDKRVGECNLRSDCLDGLNALIDAWLAHSPKSANAHLAHVRYLTALAWRLRGDGSINAVDEKSLKKYYEKMKEARIYLNDHDEMFGHNPIYYEERITVNATAEYAQERIDRLAVNGLDHNPHFSRIGIRALNYMLPKWGGSYALFEQAAYAYASYAPGGAQDEYYARMYWMLKDQHNPRETLLESDVDWERLVRGFKDMIARYPEPRNTNAYLSFACLKQDRARAREALKLVGDNSRYGAWYRDMTYEDCRKWALAND